MKVKDICDSVTDGSHNPPKGVENSDYMMLSSKNVFDDEITFDEPRFLSESDFIKENERTNVTANDVLLTIVGTVGRTAVVEKRMPTFTLQRSVAVLHPKKNICSSRFLMYALRGKRSYIENRARGVAQKGIYLREVAEIEINLPNLKEQNEIVKKLDKVHTLIKLRVKQLQCLDDLIKARFVELFGEDTDHLVERSLDEIANIVSGITKGRKTKNKELREVPYMAVSNVKDGYIDWKTVKTIMATEDEICQYRLAPNDVLMTEGGDPDKIGRGAIITEPPLDCIHQNHIFRVRFDEELILPRYFSAYLQSPRAKMYFLRAAKQTTGIASINMKQLRGLPTVIPPIERQREYVAFCEQVDKSKVAVQASLDQAQLLFDSLMQKYFG